VAEALREAAPGTELRFVGGRRGLEAELATKAGIRFHATPLPSLRDPDSRLALVAQLLLLPVAAIDALIQIARFRPRVCLTSGGFGALPVLLAAQVAGIPVYLWEGNVIVGRVNRTLAGWSTRIGATFAASLRSLPRGRTTVSGNPIRRSLLRWTKPAGRVALGLPAGLPVVLVTGGSQGAERINTALFAALSRLVRGATIVHHTGPAHIAKAQAQRALLPEADRPRYQPRAYLHEEMGAALAAADLVVGRAGSSSIAEPLAFGTPLVLIPFGAAMNGHQAANARAVAEGGAAVVVLEGELDGDRFAAVVAGLLGDPERLRRMAAAAREMGRPDAATAIASDVLRLGGCA
jgi:UDP-N-acetylglucosamine--N-acetylmuramyl-(pentapeptide) pyrophosphoryl-undecaprenol N-acetylglucosamine transferase